MSYCWFKRQEILQKAKEKYSEEKAADYHAQNQEAIKEMSKERFKNLSQEKKRQDQRVPKEKTSRIGLV